VIHNRIWVGQLDVNLCSSCSITLNALHKWNVFLGSWNQIGLKLRTKLEEDHAPDHVFSPTWIQLRFPTGPQVGVQASSFKSEAQLGQNWAKYCEPYCLQFYCEWRKLITDIIFRLITFVLHHRTESCCQVIFRTVFYLAILSHRNRATVYPSSRELADTALADGLPVFWNQYISKIVRSNVHDWPIHHHQIDVLGLLPNRKDFTCQLLARASAHAEAKGAPGFESRTEPGVGGDPKS